MRILTLSYEYPPVGGGGGVAAKALAREFVRAGHAVDLVTSRFRGQLSLATDDGVRLHRHACFRRHAHYTTGSELLTTLAPAYRCAADLIRARQPQLVHAHFALPSGIVAWLLSLRHGIPYVLTLHGSDVPGYNPDRFHLHHRLLHPLWRLVLRGASEIVSPSDYLAGLVHRHLQVPIHVIPNGQVYRALPDTPRRNLILLVSRLFPRKGIQDFIEAMREVPGGWECVVAGDGPYLAKLRAQAGRAGVAIQFPGFLARDELQSLYDAARIFVFPSVQENFPVVLLEAMQAGCAVITTDAPGCTEVVGDAGLVVPVGSPGAIAQGLRRLVSDEALCNTLAARARGRAALFEWSALAGSYIRLFDDTVDCHREAIRCAGRTNEG